MCRFDLYNQFHNYGDVAQLVERRTENPCVGGSSPLITTTAYFNQYQESPN